MLHIPFSVDERAALRLATSLVGAPDEVTLARDAILQAVSEILDDAADQPVLRIAELPGLPTDDAPHILPFA